MTLATKPGQFRRSKQNLLRYAYVRQLVNDSTMVLEWTPGTAMTADI